MGFWTGSVQDGQDAFHKGNFTTQEFAGSFDMQLMDGVFPQELQVLLEQFFSGVLWDLWDRGFSGDWFTSLLVPTMSIPVGTLPRTVF